MEIEKKYTLRYFPEEMKQCETKTIEQGYLCTNPVVRIRKSNEDYILTYKSKFGIPKEAQAAAKICNEVEVPLNREGYRHLKKKIDGHMIQKVRYLVPLDHGLKAEIDVFSGYLEGLAFVEVEFPDENMARAFEKPDWFDKDVTFEDRYINKNLAFVEDWRDL